MGYTSTFLQSEQFNSLRTRLKTQVENQKLQTEIDHFCQILIGGDQVTAARVRGSQSIRRNSDNGRMRLDAFIPVVEDWHTKMCFMQVTWVHLLHLNYISVCVPIQFIVQVIWSHLYKACILNSGCRYSLPTSDPHQQKKCY